MGCNEARRAAIQPSECDEPHNSANKNAGTKRRVLIPLQQAAKLTSKHGHKANPRRRASRSRQAAVTRG